MEPCALAYLASCRFQALKSLSLSLSEQDETRPDVIGEVFGRLPPLSSPMLNGELDRATLRRHPETPRSDAPHAQSTPRRD